MLKNCMEVTCFTCLLLLVLVNGKNATLTKNHCGIKADSDFGLKKRWEKKALNVCVYFDIVIP